MFKYSILALVLVSGNAFAAIDWASCEKIGHDHGTYTTSICETKEDCNERFSDMPEDLARCMARIKTPEDCEKEVEERNAEVEIKNLLYRCPATDTLISQKNAEKVHANHHLVYDNGEKINIDDLIADTENVYVFKATAGMSGFFGKGQYYVIGPADKDGLFMSVFPE